MGRVNILPHTEGAGMHAGMPTYRDLGSVERSAGGGCKIIRAPGDSLKLLQWRHSGSEGIFINRWGPNVYANHLGLPAVAVPLLLYSDDAFDFHQINRPPYSINATYYAFGNINPQERRRSAE